MRISIKVAVSVGLVVAISACGGGGGSSGAGGGSSTSTTTGSGGANSSTASTSGTGGSSTSSSTSSASSTSGGCIPKTCLTLAVEIAADAGVNNPPPDACDILSDGCGNFIDCDGCDNPDRACGKGYPTECVTGGPGCQGVPTENPGVEHLCGGGCTLQKNEAGFCATWPGYSLYVCTNKTVMPPMSLVPQCHTILVPGMPSDTWCCP